jgi:hypothetical protein
VIDRILGHDKSRPRFGRPGKGNDKGKVEGLVGYARRNSLVPIPVFESFEALNAYLLECCRRRLPAEAMPGLNNKTRRDLGLRLAWLFETACCNLTCANYRLASVKTGTMALTKAR